MTTSAVATGAALAAIGLLLANVQKARAAPPPEGVDPVIWDMLLNNVEATVIQQSQIEQLTQSVGQLTITLGGGISTAEDPFANMPLSGDGDQGIGFTTGHVVCDVINRGFQLPKTPIPKNKQIIVKAHPNNVGWIYVAVQRAQSQNRNSAYILLPNEGVGLFLRNANQVWVMSDTLNDTAIFIVEQE